MQILIASSIHISPPKCRFQHYFIIFISNAGVDTILRSRNDIVHNWFLSIFQTVSIKPVSFEFNCVSTVRIFMMILQPSNIPMHRMRFCFWFIIAVHSYMCLAICVATTLLSWSLYFLYILIVVSITCTSLFLALVAYFFRGHFKVQITTKAKKQSK